MRAAEPTLVSPGEMVASGLCTGCGACAVGSDLEASLGWSPDGQLQPSGGAEWLGRRDENFSRTCPHSPLARNEDEIALERFPTPRIDDRWIGRFEAAYVGHAAEPGYRDRGSSGGMVSWVAAELLRRGLVDGVAHVAPSADPGPDKRFFGYTLSRSLDELHAGAKSRYYPVEMSAVLREIRRVPGRYAVVGIPCFVKAINLLREREPILRERIAFTLGLVCGHLKSRHMVESFAWQMGLSLDEIAKVEFRLKNPDRPANWYTAQLTRADGSASTQDWWHLVDGDWGSGFFQNPACDFCDDITAETADVSFGDAWVEPYSSDGRGTNVVVARSPAVHALIAEGIAEGRLALSEVDAAFVKQSQDAGIRHRREGLAYRLGWRRQGVQPRKRVRPSDGPTALRRKLIYRARYHIARWSGSWFRLARWTGRPRIFVAWGKAVVYVYHGLAYSRGRLGQFLDRAERLLAR